MEEDKKPQNNPAGELEICQKQAEEYLNNWKRERADFINYKKDEAKRLEEFVKFANEGLVSEVIEILDDLEIAVKHNGDSEGLNQIMKKFADWLKKYDVERIKITGEKFNPELHEAIDAAKDGDGELEEVRAGYTMHGKVIRPARIKINK